MVLDADQKVAKVFALVISLVALGAPHFLLLLSKGMRRDAAAVMPALRAKRRLPWNVLISVLQKFPKARTLSFSDQPEGPLIAQLVKGRDVHTLNLTCCGAVKDVSALAGCASLHTLDLSLCSRVTWVPISSTKYLHFHFEIAEGQNTKIPSKYQNPFEV